MKDKIDLLYVDDEAINLLLFETRFGKKYAVHTADSGPMGLKVLSQNPDIQVVISDMRMPELSGIEFISKAKEHYPNKQYFILSGYEITAEIEEALSSGLILKYFQKPFKMDEIDQTIMEVIR